METVWIWRIEAQALNVGELGVTGLGHNGIGEYMWAELGYTTETVWIWRTMVEAQALNLGVLVGDLGHKGIGGYMWAELGNHGRTDDKIVLRVDVMNFREGHSKGYDARMSARYRHQIENDAPDDHAGEKRWWYDDHAIHLSSDESYVVVPRMASKCLYHSSLRGKVSCDR